jgi:hypothetical protein
VESKARAKKPCQLTWFSLSQVVEQKEKPHADDLAKKEGIK